MAWRFFFFFFLSSCRRQCSQLASYRSKVVSHSNYGLHAPDVASTLILFLTELLTISASAYNCLSFIQNCDCCNDGRLQRLTQLHPHSRSKMQRLVTPLTSAPQEWAYRRDSGHAAMGVSVIVAMVVFAVVAAVDARKNGTTDSVTAVNVEVTVSCHVSGRLLSPANLDL